MEVSDGVPDPGAVVHRFAQDAQSGRRVYACRPRRTARRAPPGSTGCHLNISVYTVGASLGDLSIYLITIHRDAE